MPHENGDVEQVMPTEDALTRAIAFFKAVSIGDDRYAFQDETGHWFSERKQELIEIFEAHSRGEAPPDPEQMTTAYPSWWSPTQQFAWRYDELARATVINPDFRLVDDGADHQDDGMEWITVDLVTGEEILA